MEKMEMGSDKSKEDVDNLSKSSKEVGSFDGFETKDISADLLKFQGDFQELKEIDYTEFINSITDNKYSDIRNPNTSIGGCK